MLTSTYRPLTPDERRALESITKTFWLLTRGSWMTTFIILVGTPTAGMLVGAIPGVLFERYLAIKGVGLACVWIGIVGGAVVGFWIFWKERAGRRKSRSTYQKDLDDDRVQVLHCTAHGAVAVEEFEDEGPSFFLDVGDGKLLFLGGQYLYDVVETGTFPSTAFEVVRLPHSGHPLAVRCTGERLKPVRQRGPFQKKEYDAIPPDGEVLDGTLDSLDDILKAPKV